MTPPLSQRRVMRNKCLKAYQLREEQGWAFSKIATDLGVAKDTVRRWIQDPGHYDPYYDEVALMRALEGERKVIDNLTLWERDEFYDRLCAIRERSSYMEWRDFLADFLSASGLHPAAVGFAMRLVDDVA